MFLNNLSGAPKKGKRKAEDAPPADFALHSDIAAHQAGEAARYRKAEPGPSVLSGRRTIQLGKIVKQKMHFALRNPRAGVADRKRNLRLSFIY